MSKVKRLLAIILTVICVTFLTSCSLFEKWVENRMNRTYIIHFNANGGEGRMDDYLVEKGQDGNIPKCNFTKDGYESFAWSTDPDGQNLYGDISILTFKLPSKIKNGDTVELYAVWTTAGFMFDAKTMGFFGDGIVASYSGAAKDVIMPTFTNGNYVGSTWGSGPVRIVNEGVFEGHTEIETVKNFPDNSVDRRVFFGCTSLKSIEMAKNKSIALIGDQAFYNCSSLQEIDLSATKSIGSEAFYMCTSIKKIIISGQIEKLGADAFYGWTQEQTIEFTKHGENVFGNEWLNGCNANIIWAE